MSKMKTLNEGLLDGLKDIYSAETQLLKALPKMEKKVANEQLKKLFNTHLKETEEQVERLQEISAIIDKKLKGKSCKAMQGLIEEGKEALELESDNEALIDSVIAGAALRVECYEIAAYESAIGMALEVGEDEIANLLDESLTEEKDSYGKLTRLCKKELFPDANMEEDEDEYEEADERSEKRPVMKSKSSKGSSSNMRASGAAKLIVLMAMGVSLALPLSFARADSPDRSSSADKKNSGTDSMSGSEKKSSTERKSSQDSTSKQTRSLRYDADNTGKNIRDANGMGKKTADSQSLAGKDNEVLANIRRRIVANDNISTYGKNIKIIVEEEDGGTVTLRGPVQSSDERNWIERAATESAAGYKVVNELEVDEE